MSWSLLDTDSPGLPAAAFRCLCELLAPGPPRAAPRLSGSGWLQGKMRFEGMVMVRDIKASHLFGR